MGLLSEIAVLAKAGYSVAEVKELLNLAQTEPAPKPEAKQPPEGDLEKPEPKPAQGQDPKLEPKPSQDQSQDQSPEQSGKQSEDLLQKIADLEKQLKEAQAANINQNANINKKSEQEQLEELARSFM